MNRYQSGNLINMAMDIYEMALAKGCIPADSDGPYLTAANLDMKIIMPSTKHVVDTLITFETKFG